ncbi:MAG: hypothetical protein QM770_06800 [Tepidisphaeraceae bacterium]
MRLVGCVLLVGCVFTGLVRADAEADGLGLAIALGSPKPDTRGLEIDFNDVYLGVRDGRPSWLVGMSITGDDAIRGRIMRVEYEMPEGFSPRTVRKDRPAGTGGPLPFGLEAVQSRDVILIKAKVTLADGSVVPLTGAHAPRATADGALRLQTIAANEPVDVPGFGSACTIQCVINGPRDRLERIVAGEFRHVVAGRQERTVLVPQALQPGNPVSMASVLTDKSLLVAVLTTDDGYQQRLVRDVVPGNTTETGLTMSLVTQVREKYWGLDENSLPFWVAEIGLSGEPETLAKVESVEYKATAIGGGDLPVEESGKLAPGTPWELFIRRPFEIEAVAHMKDGRHWTLSTAQALAQAPRPKEEFGLKWARIDDGQYWIAWIDGWEESMRRVKSVEYTMDGYDLGTAQQRRSKNIGDFGLSAYKCVGKPRTLSARIRLEDGSTQSLEATVDEPIAPLGWTSSSRYWGDGLWEATLQLTGDENVRRQTTAIDFKTVQTEPPGPVIVPASPERRARVLFDGASHASVSQVDVLGGDAPVQLPGGDLRVEGDRQDELELRVDFGEITKVDAPKIEYVVHVGGPESMMSRIRSVEYSIKEDEKTFTPIINGRFGERTDGFEYRAYAKRIPTATAKVTMIDGSVVELMSK